MFALHAAGLGYFYRAEELKQRESLQAGQQVELQREEQSRQQALKRELEPLVRRRDYRAARRFVQAHPTLRAAGMPLSLVLCPDDGSAPDLPLLQLMQQHGAPQAGDLLVESAKCRMASFRAVMSLGIPVTAVAKSGLTPLMVATDLSLLDSLLQQGLHVDAPGPEGRTALMYHRSAEVTRLLLSHGANAKQLDAQGRSVLHFGGPWQTLAACYSLLLEAGADPNLQDHTEREDTPLLAMASRQREWVHSAADVLVKHGARPLLLVHGKSAVSELIASGILGETLKWPGFWTSPAAAAHIS